MKKLKQKKWFTLIESMLAIVLFSIWAITMFIFFKNSNNVMFDLQKEQAAQRIAFDYMESIDNIRTSLWVDANINPYNTPNGKEIDLTRCWATVAQLKINAVTPDLLGWFCKEIPWFGKSFSELNGYYSLEMGKNKVTNEKQNKLIPIPWTDEKPGNIENFNYYSAFFKDFKPTEKRFIDYENENLMRERFEWKKLNLQNYTKYFNNKKSIPGRAMLVTIKIENGREEDLKGFLPSEKEYYRKQIKVATVKVEYSTMNWERKSVVNRRIFTNFKNWM